MANIEQQLELLGLTDSEVVVYLKLAGIGKTSANEISHATGINRTTVYSILKQLAKMHLVVEDIGLSVREFHVSPVSNIEHLLEKEEKALEEKKDVAQDVMKAIESLSKGAKYVIPKIQFITEERIEKFMYQRAPEWSASINERDGHYWGFQGKNFVDKYDDWIDWYWNEPFSQKLILKLLSNDSDDEQRVAAKGYERRHIAFWKDAKFTSTLWIMGDYVVMIVLSESPNYLVEIHDATLAYNLAETYRNIWEDIDKK